MINEKLYNELMQHLSASVRKAINETLGTLLLDKPEVEDIIYKIIEDLENRNLLTTFYNNPDIISEIGNFKYYKNIYTDTGIEWLKTLLIIIAPLIGNETAAALIDNDILTIFNKKDKTIELATIVLMSPLAHLDTLETDIYHELNHYI